MKNSNFREYGIYLVIFLIFTLFVLFQNNINPSSQTVKNFTYGDLVTTLSQEIQLKEAQPESENKKDKKETLKDLNNKSVDYNITKVDIKSDSDVLDSGIATVYFADGSRKSVEISSISKFMELANKAATNTDILFTTSSPYTSWQNLLMSLLPTIAIIGISIFILFIFTQQMQGGGKMMNFGKSKAKLNLDPKNKMTFKNVAGLEEEKEDLEEIVEFLKTPKKFVDIGARIPKGVLLVGPPGTGKTLLAKAIAGEAGVPFFSISGSDFVEMFVGVGASRVRDLFEQAKRNTPCLIFIDEIDAVGRKRGAGLGGGHDEREQTLNQLLVEMDGFGANEGIIILAATNRPDILDPALLRPGRFDRRVVVNRPDVKGREEILSVHSEGKKISADVDLKEVAKTTSGFTGADLENLLNEAALLAARENKTEISADYIRRAFVKVGIGTEKKSRVISEKEREITAYHEAGHAIIFETLSELDPVHIISIIPTGLAGGYTMPLPSDRGYHSKKYMFQDMVSLFGGRAAEELIIKDITTGASNDIERATALARDMVTRYGMSEKIGPILLGDDRKEVFLGNDLGHARNYSESVATEVDAEINRIISEAYSEAKKILTENINVLHDTAKLLIEKEKITGAEFREIIERYSTTEDNN